MMEKKIVFTTFRNPLGITGLAANNGKLICIRNRIDSTKEFKDFLESLYRQSANRHPKSFEDLVKQFNLYFRGLLKTFSYSLDYSIGTNFQQKVWQSLKSIPYGETRSYQWLAKSVATPKASRAVGSANGKNPLPIIIPCHRVIRKNGQLGGYTSGTDIKAFLLELEGFDHGSL